MTENKKTYLALSLVCIISASAFVAARNNELVQYVLALPFVASLFAAMFQILRDAAAHERALSVQAERDRFTLAVGSHMGSVAFDKHVAFCEEYLHEAQSTLHTLLREGPSPNALAHAWTLNEIRQKYAVWLTAKLELELDPFEKALREIGAGAHYSATTQDDSSRAGERSKVIESLYNTFAKLMGFGNWNGQPLTDELAVTAMVRRLRRILGTEELVSLREAILKKSIEELKVQRQSLSGEFSEESKINVAR